MGENGLVDMERIKSTDIIFVLTAGFLMGIVDVLFYTIVDGNPLKSFLILGANYMMALGLCIVLQLASFIHMRQMLQIAFQFVISCYCCLLAFCWYRFGAPMDKSMIALVTETNNAEAHEFFRVYITPVTIIVLLLAVLLVFTLFVYVTCRTIRLSRKLFILLGVYTIVGCCCLGYSFYTLPGRIEGIFRTEQRNLADYLQHPKIQETMASHPDVVMIIIGESFVRSHSSLYGYDKLTTPKLQQLADSGQLIVFREPIAPATHTAEAFKYFMTTYNHKTTDKDWYECLTLIEALHASDYHTAWFSNQAKSGWYDNISAAFAKLCKYFHYTSTPEEGEQGAKPDGVLFDCVGKYVKNFHPDSRHAVFIHLMGQHVDFEQRYPAQFSYFKETQYTNREETQRRDYATYDNATRYNDYVVDSLFSILRDKNAIAFYFSDHGMDFYESAPDYCSHANNNNQASVKAGLQIPFVIYTTASYRTAHPDVLKVLHKMSARPYYTEHLMDLVLRVTGYQVDIR